LGVFRLQIGIADGIPPSVIDYVSNEVLISDQFLKFMGDGVRKFLALMQ
jgi:hypothetical protein